MKKIVLCLFLIPALISCSSKVVPLKNTYSNGNFESVSPKSKEQVWDNIIDMFTKRGLSIRIIDKSSGLIISNETRLSWTFESKAGKLENPASWVVIEKVVNQGSKLAIAPTMVTGEWNIRIKDAQGGGTSIAINLVNPKYATGISSAMVNFKPGSFQSTGVFEHSIFDIIK